MCLSRSVISKSILRSFQIRVCFRISVTVVCNIRWFVVVMTVVVTNEHNASLRHAWASTHFLMSSFYDVPRYISLLSIKWVQTVIQPKVGVENQNYGSDSFGKPSNWADLGVEHDKFICITRRGCSNKREVAVQPSEVTFFSNEFRI